MEGVLVLVIIIAALSLIAVLVWLLIKSEKRTKKLDRIILDFQNRYRGIVDIDKEIEKRKNDFSIAQLTLQKESDEMRDSLRSLKSRYQEALIVYDDLSHQNNLLRNTLEIAEFGVYEPHFNLDASEHYKTRLIQNREKQKDLIVTGVAIKCFTHWQVGNSRRDGEVMTKRAMKLTLRAFNGECDSLISKVKWNNVEQAEERIRRIFEAINKLNKSNDVHIQREFLDLKIAELRLTYEYELKKYEEREEQRRIREQMREEEKARRDFEKAIKETEREERLLLEAMRKAQEQILIASEIERERYEAQLAELQTRLKEAEDRNQRAISMAQQTKSGHVYVISNVGSFGENVYKVGMTRRLDPFDRINELGDASVPFRFDVHVMIYSENAPELENQLHRALNDRRLNWINLRREYFHIEFEEIVKIVRESHGEIEFIKVPEAKEFRESLVIRERRLKGEQPAVVEVAFPSSEELFEDD